MEIGNNKQFKFFDSKGNELGNGRIETILSDDFDPNCIDAYIVRFDNGVIKCLNVNECKFEEISE